MWQYPTDNLQGAHFLALLAAVRMYLPEEQYLLTTALPASRAVLGTIDLRRAAEYLDLLNLMAYDLYGPWKSRSGHHAQLYPSSSKEDESSSGSYAVSYLLSQGFPAKKILFGIPLFGRYFPGVTGPGHRFGRPSGDGTVDYSQLPRKGTKEIVDRRACAAFCVGGGSSGSGFITYDNPETVKTKAAFVRQKGLGVSVSLLLWRVSYICQKLISCAHIRDSSTGRDPRMPKTASGAWSRLDSRRCTALDDDRQTTDLHGRG